MAFKAEHTVYKTIRYLVIAMLASLVIFWLIGGGIGKIIDKARAFQFTSISDALSPSNGFGSFRLPWQIDAPSIDVQGISGNGGSEGSYDASGIPPGSGTPSPYVGQVAIEQDAAQTQSASGQYITLRSQSGDLLHISGWSLESAVSGARVYIPEATSLFIMGRVNSVGQISLAPGGRAIVVSGASPVGVSFQENRCIGYLGTLQPFTPALASNCPAPLSAIPRTAENEARLGASCFQYLLQLQPCTFPQNPPASLSPICRAEIQNKLSYNGCVDQSQNISGFSSGSWRVYLARGTPLWGVQHDIIRLLDANGRVVNVLNY